MTITDFLLARIEEDEAAAQALGEEPGRQWLRFLGSSAEVGAARRFAARVNPARVLAECVAKRRIVELHQARRQDPSLRAMGQLPACAECGSDVFPRRWPCPTLRALASVYADHPDYDPAWR